MAAAKARVDALIAGNKLVVFSKEWCPFCAKAKASFDAVVGPGKYTLLELENASRESIVDPSAADFQDYFKELVGTRSVPKVWLEGKFIGGGDDIVALHKSGQLENMAVQAGLIARVDKGTQNERFFVNGKLQDGDMKFSML